MPWRVRSSLDRPLRRLPVLAAWGALVVATIAIACGTSAVGVDACRQIEDARCMRAPGCDIDISDPLHRTGTDVSSCIRYYDTACLHGVDLSSEPSSAEVSACVAAVNDGDCSVVSAPETDPACSWLIVVPTDAGADADADDDAADGDTDASDGS
jgi:hypothetical protein